MMSAIALTKYFTGTSAWNHERASRFCLRLLQKTALRLFLSSSLLSTTCSPMFLAIPPPPTHATHLQYCACVVWCSSRSLLLGCTLSAACSISPWSSHLFLQRLSVLVQCENAFVVARRVVASSSRRLLICRDWTGCGRTTFPLERKFHHCRAKQKQLSALERVVGTPRPCLSSS